MIVGKFGLVVITLERYFKSVHVYAYNRYRKWMTAVGLAAPWVSGFCSFVIPAVVMSRPVPGQCPRFYGNIEVSTVMSHDAVVSGCLECSVSDQRSYSASNPRLMNSFIRNN